VLLGANPDTTGTFITTYDTPKYADSKNHRMRIVANGSTVKLYLDDVFGAEVAFPFAQGLQFGFGSYVNLSNAVGNVIRASWDNAVIKGFPPVVESRLSIVKQGADVVLTWTGTGTLQSSTALGSAAAWTNVTPAPAGNTYTTQPAGQARFYRVQQ
jgi:hypothetical protein